MYQIFGKVENRCITFVGCTKSSELPADSIVLQIVKDHPELIWVKWSVRFRRTLTDKRALSHPFVRYFKNPARLTRLLEDKGLTRYAAEQNAEFLAFHRRNPHVLDYLVNAALAKKADGRDEYSMDQLLGEVRWDDIEINRGIEKVKISDSWSPWYSRAVQIANRELIGFFAVRSSVADALVWIDGCSWQQFALDHAEEIRWHDPFAELPDSDWECLK